MQEPAKKDWKAKREPQLLQLFLGRAYAQKLGLQGSMQAGLEKIDSVTASERADAAVPSSHQLVWESRAETSPTREPHQHLQLQSTVTERWGQSATGSARSTPQQLISPLLNQAAQNSVKSHMLGKPVVSLTQAPLSALSNQWETCKGEKNLAHVCSLW